MTQPNLVALAQQGDPRAIAALVNQHLQPHGIQGRVTVKAGSLHLLLEGEEVPDASTYLPQIADLLSEHQIHAFETVMVYGRKQGEKKPAWQDKVEVSEELHTVFHADDPDLAFEATPSASAGAAPDRPKSSSREPDTLLQPDLDVAAPGPEGDLDDRGNQEQPPLGFSFDTDSEQNGNTRTASPEIPADFASGFGLGEEGGLGLGEDDIDTDGLDREADATDAAADLETTSQPWYIRKIGLIIGALVLGVAAVLGVRFWLNQSPAPEESPLLTESPDATLPASPPVEEAPTSPTAPASPTPVPVADPFREAVNRATSAAQLTQTARTRQEWQTVANQWREAIALMQAVPADSPNYAVAQERAVTYQTNLAYAEQAAATRPE